MWIRAQSGRLINLDHGELIVEQGGIVYVQFSMSRLVEVWRGPDDATEVIDTLWELLRPPQGENILRSGDLLAYDVLKRATQ